MKNFVSPSIAISIAGVLSILAVFMLSCNGPKQQQPDDAVQKAYQKELDDWHSARIRGLKKENGWLSLAALTWLNNGANEIASVGTVTVKKGRTFVSVVPNVHAALNGKKITAGALKADDEKTGPDTLVIGTRTHIIIKRGDRYALRIYDSASPARTQFTGIDRYPVSAGWRIEARWEPYAAPKTLSIETVIPGLFEEGHATGAAVFSIDGKEYRLEPTVDDARTDYFFVFGDKTNGAETYGAGRFLHAGPPKDGKILLDFNKATNPPCAFTEFATCPLASANNRLPFRIDAGEKKYGHH